MKGIRNYLIVVLMVLCASFTARAAKADAVSMVSYEQSWLDYRGTISLRNNMEESVRSVSFRLTYLDMNNNQLDYKDFDYRIDILPGMSKKLDIPAYEHSRNYHYYRTKDEFGHPAFKLKYELLGYNGGSAAKASSGVSRRVTELVEAVNMDDEVVNVEAGAVELDDDIDECEPEHSDEDGSGDYVLNFLCGFWAMGLYIGLYVLVGEMARKRNRNAVGWVLLSIIISPLLVIIILLCIGSRPPKIPWQY